MTHETDSKDSRVQRLARVLRDVHLPCSDDVRRGDSVPTCADVADVVAAMTGGKLRLKLMPELDAFAVSL